MKKSKHYVDTVMSQMDSNGHLIAHTEVLQKLTVMNAQLQALLESPNTKSEYEAFNAYLKEKLSRITSLQCFCTDIPELHRFSLLIFPNITSIKVDMCPPSTIAGLYDLKDRLISIDITNSGIPDLSKMIAPIEEKQLNKFKPMILSRTKLAVPDKLIWTSLKKLRLSNCGIAKLDASFHLLPSLVYLDLSNNQIIHVIHLHDCYNLKHLNLSHNRIRVLSNLERVLGNIIDINLSFNNIQSLDGVDKLFSLQKLNVSNNFIDDFEEIKYLVKLPCLESLWLEDNPISMNPSYRIMVYNIFVFEGNLMDCNRQLPALDGQMIGAREQHYLRGILFRAPENDQRELSHCTERTPISSSTNSDFASRESSQAAYGLNAESFSPSFRARNDSTPNGDGSRQSFYSGHQDQFDRSDFLNSIDLHERCNPSTLPTWQENRKNSQVHRHLESLQVEELTESFLYPSIEDIRNQMKSLRIQQKKEAEEEASRREIERIAQEAANNIFAAAPSTPLSKIRSSFGSMVAETLRDSMLDDAKKSLFANTEDMDMSSKMGENLASPSSILEGDDMDDKYEEDGRTSPEDGIDVANIEKILNESDDGDNSSNLGHHGMEMEDEKDDRDSSTFSENCDISLLHDVMNGSSAYKFTYTGDVEFSDYNILENLELYCRVQVFGIERPTGDHPYLRKKSGSFESDIDIVNISSQSERFITVFLEKIVECEGNSGALGYSNPPSSVNTNLTTRLSTLNFTDSNGNSTQSKASFPEAIEIEVALVLTDERLYLIRVDDIPKDAVFSDAFVPTVLRYHEIFALRSIAIFFGFQRCALTFSETMDRELDDSFFEYLGDANNTAMDEISYVILTRDKPRTYAIITKIPQVANSVRNGMKKGLTNIKIFNTDQGLLQEVTRTARQANADADIIFYQMLYQVFRKRPGLSFPRTVILTPSLLLLCEERLDVPNVVVRVLDVATFREISKIQSEEEPNYLTLVFKPSNLFSTKRKWRLKGDTKAAMQRLNDECRRACNEHGNNDV